MTKRFQSEQYHYRIIAITLLVLTDLSLGNLFAFCHRQNNRWFYDVANYMFETPFDHEGALIPGFSIAMRILKVYKDLTINKFKSGFYCLFMLISQLFKVHDFLFMKIRIPSSPLVKILTSSCGWIPGFCLPGYIQATFAGSRIKTVIGFQKYHCFHQIFR